MNVRGPDAAALEPTLAEQVERLDRLVQAFEEHPHPTTREQAVELLQAVDAVHRAGLTRLARGLDELGAVGQRVLADPAVRLLLELYDLLPPEESSTMNIGFVPLSAVRINTGARP